MIVLIMSLLDSLLFNIYCYNYRATNMLKKTLFLIALFVKIVQ